VSAPGAAPRAAARTEPVRTARGFGGSCAAGADDRGVELLRVGGVEVANSSVRTFSVPTLPHASRVASTAIETLSSSKLATERSPWPRAPSTSAIAPTPEAAVRDVRAV